MSKKTLAYVVYPGISLLELVANRTLLGGIMAQGSLLKLQAGYDVVVVGERIEEIATDTPMAIIPQKTFADVPQPDALVVIGGGADTLPALENADLIAYVQHAGQHEEWVAATSTGSLLLAAAGLLEGRLATTHWAFALYPGLTVFDLAGPLEVFSTLSRIAPQFRPVVVAEQASPVMTDIGVRMVPNATFADLPHPDAFFVPGGLTQTFRAMSNPAIRQYIRTAAHHAQWIVSVCTG